MFSHGSKLARPWLALVLGSLLLAATAGAEHARPMVSGQTNVSPNHAGADAQYLDWHREASNRMAPAELAVPAGAAIAVVNAECWCVPASSCPPNSTTAH